MKATAYRHTVPINEDIFEALVELEWGLYQYNFFSIDTLIRFQSRTISLEPPYRTRKRGITLWGLSCLEGSRKSCVIASCYGLLNVTWLVLV